jgi:UDP-2-acetamido-2-deoxy-ribo-hexuluronate aminotransferase
MFYHKQNQVGHNILPEHVNRTKLMENLEAEGISTMIYYRKAMHIQEAYKDCLTAGETTLPISEQISNRVLSLPMSGYINEHDAKRVCELLKIYLNS